MGILPLTQYEPLTSLPRWWLRGITPNRPIFWMLVNSSPLPIKKRFNKIRHKICKSRNHRLISRHSPDPFLVECMAMRTYLIGPTDIASSCPGSPHRACVGTRGAALILDISFVRPLAVYCKHTVFFFV